MFSQLDTTHWMGRLKRWVPALIWMFVIFSGSGDSNSMLHSSRLIEPFFRWLMPNIAQEQLDMIHVVVRKGAHMAEFAFLACLFLQALAIEQGDTRRWIPWAWILSTIYAASDEIHQMFVPNRGASVGDVMIDSAGAALGLLGCFLFLRAKARKAEAQEPPPKPVPAPLPPQRPCFADRLLCTLHGEDFENRSQVHLEVPDRLQRENGGRIILGRSSAKAQLCIKNTSISGEHFSLQFHNGQFAIEDLDSSNGTRVNGRRLTPFQPANLADGDRIEAGEVLLHFRQLA